MSHGRGLRSRLGTRAEEGGARLALLTTFLEGVSAEWVGAGTHETAQRVGALSVLAARERAAETLVNV